MKEFALTVKAAQADTLLSALQSAIQATRGSERTAIRALEKQIAGQVHDAVLMSHARGMEEKLEDDIQAAAYFVLSAFPYIKGRGLTPSLLKFLEGVERAFLGAQSKFNNRSNSIRTGKTRKTDRQAELDRERQFIGRTMQALNIKLEELVDDYVSSNDAAIEVSTNYTQADQRKRLAKMCFNTSIKEGQEASNWTSLDMVAMSFGDQRKHLLLAKALLQGKPQAIRMRADMDTSTREGLAEPVWSFICGSGLEKLKKVKTA